ncbi:MAG: hypothetical protein AAF800_00870 [Planctomycetota bacterium]
MTTGPNDRPRRFPLACLTLGALALCFGTGCQSSLSAAEKRHRANNWSAQYSWDDIEDQQNQQQGVQSFTKAFSPELADMFGGMSEDFEQEIAAAQTAELPKGGVGGLLQSIRGNVADAIRSQEQYLRGGGSGLILLGELTGPDNKPLGTSSRGALEIQQFMGDLLTKEGLGDRWYYLSMTPKEAEQYFSAAGAGGGNAIQDGGNTYVYNQENLLVLNLSIAADANQKNYSVEYTGIGNIAAPATRTTEGISGAEVKYFYQPYLGEWIVDAEEMRRRNSGQDGSKLDTAG